MDWLIGRSLDTPLRTEDASFIFQVLNRFTGGLLRHPFSRQPCWLITSADLVDQVLLDERCSTEYDHFTDLAPKVARQSAYHLANITSGFRRTPMFVHQANDHSRLKWPINAEVHSRSVEKVVPFISDKLIKLMAAIPDGVAIEA